MEKKISGHEIRRRFNEMIHNGARYLELAFSLVILIVIALSAISLVRDLLGVPLDNMDDLFFTDFLSRALGLVVGVEFVKMMCKVTSETLVEVLMFAIARQMIVEHLSTWETLIGVIAIAVLFAIRKFFLLNTAGEKKGDSLFTKKNQG